MAITAYFVRHGQTYLNRYNRVQGWSDAPLTAKGKADAQQTGKELAAIDLTTFSVATFPGRLPLPACCWPPTPTPRLRSRFQIRRSGKNFSATLKDKTPPNSQAF